MDWEEKNYEITKALSASLEDQVMAGPKTSSQTSGAVGWVMRTFPWLVKNEGRAILIISLFLVIAILASVYFYYKAIGPKKVAPLSQETLYLLQTVNYKDGKDK